MNIPLISVRIRHEQDVVAARQRARHIARLLGMVNQDQTRVATAVSEISRNAFQYGGGGTVEFLIEGRVAPQLLVIRVSDNGPGIPDLDSVLQGRYRSQTGMGMGLIGARRLMDYLQVTTPAEGGTTVTLTKLLPRGTPLITGADVERIVNALMAEGPRDAYHELLAQNQELVVALDDLRRRTEELARVNQELEDTNRGVVALYAELDEKADHLRRADELKSRFLSNMSHEFRSPLNSIVALTGLLLDAVDGGLTPGQTQQVGYIRKAAQDLTDLVNDLLDLAKVEAGKTQVRALDFRVPKLFGALRGMLRPLLVNPAVNLVFEAADELPLVHSDEGKVSQILRNFISNALKFTDRGEIRVSAALDRATESVVFSVADTGIGIAAADQERIFQDFTQLDNPIQKKVRGTGLGLPLSRRLARLLGGDVWVESQLGLGSAFHARLPRRYQTADLEPVAPVQWLPEPDTLPVMVVEDSAEAMLTYAHYLKSAGFQAVPARTVSEARQVLATVKPAAVILDIVLSGEDSWGLLAELKADPDTRTVPIVVVSTVDDERKGLHLGADRYFLKPVDRANLVNELHALTGRTSARRVLVIDDDEAARYQIRYLLRDAPLTVTEAATGAEGLTRIAGEHPDVVLLDLNMPDMGGMDVLNRLGSELAASPPVVVCTSQFLSPDQERQISERAEAVVSKEQLDTETLIRILEAAIRSRGADGVRRGK